MVRAFSFLCCFIVGLQLLIGVPGAVCLVFFALFGGLGPIAIEVHPGPSQSPHMLMHSATIAPPSAPLTIAPPPNIIPPASAISLDNPVLEARAQHGSPLAGTVLSENTPPDVERDLFVAAFQKVASEAANESSPPPPTINAPANATAACSTAADNCCENSSFRQRADQFVIRHLYEMADMDEQSSNYERADQWRALARDIRQADEAAPCNNSPVERSSAEPPSLNLP